MRWGFAVLIGVFCARASGEEDRALPLLQKAFANEEAQEKEREQYSFKEHAERWAAGKKPKLTYTRDYEYVYLEGEAYRHLIAKDGKPLTGRDAAEELQRMKKTASERRADLAQGKRPRRTLPFCNVPKPDVIRFLEHRLIGEEVLNGRKSWVVDANPKGELESPEAVKAASYRHRYWIDREDGVIAQHRCEVVRPGVETLPGSWATTLKSSSEGRPWLPLTQEAESFTKNDHWTQKHRYSAFKKFGSDTTITFGEEVAK